MLMNSEVITDHIIQFKIVQGDHNNMQGAITCNSNVQGAMMYHSNVQGAMMVRTRIESM
jgi:hypothetical protein